MTGTTLYLPSQGTGTITKLATTTNASLALNSNTPKGQSLYVADISVTDSNGNTAMGNLPVTVTDSSGKTLATGTVENGTTSLILPYYNDSATATVTGSVFYYGSSGTGTVQYNLTSMIQTQGASGSNATENAGWQIIRDYIVNSTVFYYNSATGNWTKNTNDGGYTWTYNSISVGYGSGAQWSVSQQELNSGQFDNETVLVGELQKATVLGFPPVSTSTSWLKALEDLAITLTSYFIKAVDDAWTTITQLASSGLKWIEGLWNNTAGKVMGPLTEMEKNIATLEVNFVVDTVWNEVINPILPSSSSTTLSANLQSFLYQITDPNVISTWTGNTNKTLTPITGNTQSVNLDLTGSTSTFSSLFNSMGPFSLIQNIGGMEEVYLAINDIINRTATHIASWIASAPSNLTLTNSISNNLYDTLSISQIQSIYDLTSQYQSSGENIVTNTIGTSVKVGNGSTIPYSPNIYLNSDTQTDWATVVLTGLQNLLLTLGGKIRDSIPYILLTPVGFAVVGAVLLQYVLALTLVLDDLTVQSIKSGNLISILTSNIPLAQQILFHPATGSYNQALGAIAWIQASKMGENIFSIIKHLKIFELPEWKVAIQAGQTLVFGFTGLYYDQILEDAKTSLTGATKEPSLLFGSIGVSLNSIRLTLETFASCLELLGSIWDFLGDPLGVYSTLQTSIEPFTSSVNLGILVLIILIQAFQERSKITNGVTFLIFLTSLTGQTLKATLFSFGIVDSFPGLITLATTAEISFGSDFIQYWAMIQNIYS